VNVQTVNLPNGRRWEVHFGGAGPELLWLHGLRGVDPTDPLLTALQTRYHVTAPVAPGSEPAPPPAGLLSAGAPNFRIHDGLLQITVPMRIKSDMVFIDQIVLVQATGTFVRRGDVFVFAPKTVFVGSCPVDRIPKAVDFVMKKVFDSQPVPPEIAASWGKLADVTIEGSTLRLTMP